MYKCERCNKEVYTKYGSGRFCSRSCASSKIHTEETKLKISDSIKKNPHGIAVKPSERLEYVCEICNRSIRGAGSYKNHLAKHNRSVIVGCNYYGSKTILNITDAELAEYRKAHTVCEICGQPETDKGKQNLAIDHDHKTGKFRGLLCKKCNTALGTYENNAEGFINYLRKSGS